MNLVKLNTCRKERVHVMSWYQQVPNIPLNITRQETGNHNHLMFSIMKTKLGLQKPKRLVYYCFETLKNITLNKSYPRRSMLTTRAMHFKILKITGNHKPYVYNTLKLAIMKRSHLKNKANKT